MGSHATFNQTHRTLDNTIFTVSLIAACVSFALCYAATLLDHSPVMAIAAASVNAAACMISDNVEKQNLARMIAIAGLTLLVIAVMMAV